MAEDETQENEDEESEAEDTDAESAPADVSTDGPAIKDVDVKDVPVKSFKSESTPALGGEAWVVLGEHPDVPPELVGHIAAVVNAPVENKTDKATGAVTQVLPKDAQVTVVERAQGIRLTLPMEAFSKVTRDGRVGVLPHA